jgi:hypothetical protein
MNTLLEAVNAMFNPVTAAGVSVAAIIRRRFRHHWYPWAES